MKVAKRIASEAASNDDEKNRHHFRCGTRGGRGPHLVALLSRLLTLHRDRLGPERYQTDRDAPHVVLFQVPKIGVPRVDRALLDEDQPPPFQLVWAGLARTIRQIEFLGVSVIYIACNTLHLLEERINGFLEKETLSIRFCSMVAVVRTHLLKFGLHSNALVLGTRNTMAVNSELLPYHGTFAASGNPIRLMISLIEPPRVCPIRCRL